MRIHLPSVWFLLALFAVGIVLAVHLLSPKPAPSLTVIGHAVRPAMSPDGARRAHAGVRARR